MPRREAVRGDAAARDDEFQGDQARIGLTLGIGDILRARKIVLLITGEGKERVIARFLDGTVTTDLPASFLWLHHDLEVLLDDSGG